MPHFGKKTSIVLLLICLATSLGCLSGKQKGNDLAGVWSLQNRDYPMRLTLREDGSYNCSVESERHPMEHVGSWRIRGKDLVFKVKRSSRVVMEGEKIHERIVDISGDKLSLDTTQGKLVFRRSR